ncbi:MAG: carboxylating nicotinate-nucleotide diphosphorylase [Williamsia herbipolensis]|uniref:nicotinate-nucleotide diphosphorylase (carboxylating) n=1 Tax=Williamsia serinedens TaxID=391736 RepID=A0ABT1H5G3_9NOCA|nr:carboxylating nicotinate-nucleotide diphosphorylase [Williamsia herbipolensis]MCP2162478.1 nicotinate-nucleotide pyrophosphorylase [carboxylating] [Williamsia serinedens]
MTASGAVGQTQRRGHVLTPPPDDDVRRVVAEGLAEDLRYGPDVTTAATVPAGATTTAVVASRAAGVVAGVDVALAVFTEVMGDAVAVDDRVDDGTRVGPGDVVLRLTGPTAGLLTAERTALNLLCHLSGIATATAAWVDAIDGTGAAVRDSRKTLPGLRALQKYAVRAGGGLNHRMGLGDAALIKDNHIAAAGSVEAAWRAVRAAAPDIAVEIEVDSLAQLDEALALDAQLILLDNFELWETQMAVARRTRAGSSTLLESSGGLSLADAHDYARTGVDFLAVGGLTHSVTALDLGLDL